MDRVLRSLISLSLFAGAVMHFCPAGGVRRVSKLLCAAILAASVLAPLQDFDYDRLSMEQARFQSTEAEITHKADRMQDDMKKLFLAKNCEDYIESRGMEMGLKIRRVSIELEQGAGGEWLPFSASVFAAGPETEVKELSRLLVSELGIPIERQVWTLNE